METLDFIIVGQGIAGSNLAFELLSRGKKIAIFDASWRGAACLVAAGVVNPITGQRLVKSWRSGVAHPCAKKFYRALERELNADFFHDRKILQLCKSPEEHALWARRMAEPEYAEFIGEGSASPVFGGLNDRFGHRFIERSAWVEPAALMPAYARYFESLRVLFRGEFDYRRLKIFSGGVEYSGVKASRAIFCEGWQAVRNPYFSWLPYRPAKGEILRVCTPEPLPEHIIHRGNWLMKCAEGQFRVGSTWDRENLDCLPTESARAELLRAARSILPFAEFGEVLEHSAGVRPCTATTRPHIGAHPELPQLLSFNGFGSKGYALTPFFAREFADYLDGLKPLDPEADLARHVGRFFVRANAAASEPRAANKKIAK